MQTRVGLNCFAVKGARGWHGVLIEVALEGRRCAPVLSKKDHLDDCLAYAYDRRHGRGWIGGQTPGCLPSGRARLSQALSPLALGAERSGGAQLPAAFARRTRRRPRDNRLRSRPTYRSACRKGPSPMSGEAYDKTLMRLPPSKFADVAMIISLRPTAAMSQFLARSSTPQPRPSSAAQTAGCPR